MHARKITFQSEAEKLQGERDGYRRIIPMAGVVEALYAIHDKYLDTDFGTIPVRIYRPNDKKPLPVLIYFHGGGYVSGGLDTHDQQLRYFSKHAGIIVIAVAYSLAPERKYPAAISDAYYTVKWVHENCAALHIDHKHIAIGGDSAGGLLSALLAMKLRDEKIIPIAFQLLLCPNLDLTMSSDSWKALGEKAYILSARKQIDFYNWFLPSDIDRGNETVSPIFASDFSVLPPTMIVTAAADPLKDEGRLYMEKLQQARVPVMHKEYEGVVHGFYQLSGVIDKGKVALDDVCAALKAALAGE
ncbi:alpha/beta hydrolase [Pedobacter heparinus]|nr:alpha/beta hydrolase [Pedobacter heparinus]